MTLADPVPVRAPGQHADALLGGSGTNARGCLPGVLPAVRPTVSPADPPTPPPPGEGEKLQVRALSKGVSGTSTTLLPLFLSVVGVSELGEGRRVRSGLVAAWPRDAPAVSGAVGEGWAVGGTKRRPYGPTAKTRQMVLAALGVVKVATAEQIRQLMCPGTASAQTVRNGCLDLGRDGLVESLGSVGRTNAAGNLVSEKLWNLTGPGLEAAAAVLDRPVREMGGTARGAARSGAKHAVKVTDTLAAFLQTPPEPTRPVPRKRAQPATTSPSSSPAGNDTATAPAAARERPQGLGKIASWATEVVLPVSGTLTTPGKNSPRADAVLTVPEAGVPVMFVEVDNGTESPLTLAHKAGRYREFFRRTVKPPSPSPNPHAQKGEPVPMWETLYGPLGRRVSAAGDRVHQAGRPGRDEQPDQQRHAPDQGALGGPVLRVRHQLRLGRT